MHSAPHGLQRPGDRIARRRHRCGGISRKANPPAGAFPGVGGRLAAEPPTPGKPYGRRSVKAAAGLLENGRARQGHSCAQREYQHRRRLCPSAPFRYGQAPPAVRHCRRRCGARGERPQAYAAGQGSAGWPAPQLFSFSSIWASTALRWVSAHAFIRSS